MRARWWIFLGAIILCGASLAWAASSGPDPFPTHWGASGTPDSWSPRGRAIATLAAGAGGVALVFAAIAKYAAAMPTGMINVPHREFWLAPEHRGELDDLLQRTMLTIGTGVLVLLAITVVGTIVNSESNPVLGVAIWVFVAVVLGSAAHLIWTLTRPPRANLER